MHRLGSSLDLPNFLRRTDTEKPSSANVNNPPSQSLSDQSTAAQMASLAEALNAARKEVETQSMRLKEVEDLLVQERVRREDAEERAKRLEKERKQREGNQGWLQHPESAAPKEDETSTPIEDEKADETIVGAPAEDAAPSDLLREFEKLKLEFSEVKTAADRWKHEKEQAEKERDAERAERQSLAEMIERIRAEEVERIAKEKRKEEKRKARRSSSTPAVENDETRVVETAEDRSVDDENEDPSGDESKKSNLQNGHVDGEQVKDSPRVHDLGTLVSRNTQIYHAAPYLSAVSVVLIGVAVMALVNRMQKGER